MNLLKGQNLKLDQTIENQVAQISDIRNMMGTMAQHIEFILQRLYQIPGSSSQGKKKHTLSLEGSDSKNKVLHEDRIITHKVHKPKHFFPTFNEEDVHRWLYKCTQYFEIKDIANS